MLRNINVPQGSQSKWKERERQRKMNEINYQQTFTTEMLKENPSGRRNVIPVKTLHLYKELKSAGNGIYKGKDKIHFSLIFKCSEI